MKGETHRCISPSSSLPSSPTGSKSKFEKYSCTCSLAKAATRRGIIKAVIHLGSTKAGARSQAEESEELAEGTAVMEVYWEKQQALKGLGAPYVLKGWWGLKEERHKP